MSVYVDPMQPCIPNRKWRWKFVAHLLADTLDELQAFASGLGLKRVWLQHGSFLHYDLTASMRAKAVYNGAEEIEGERLLDVFRQLRQATP